MWSSSLRNAASEILELSRLCLKILGDRDAECSMDEEDEGHLEVKKYFNIEDGVRSLRL